METRQKWPVVLVDDEEEILFGAEYLLNTHGITTVTSPERWPRTPTASWRARRRG
jgi:hypothetical protein